MKVKEVKLPIATRIRNFLKKHPNDVFLGRDISSEIGCSPENINHQRDYCIKLGTVRYYSYNKKNLDELKERFENAY